MNVDNSTMSTETTAYKTLAQEIKETLVLIQNNPQDPINYLRAGKLYSCQGNQKYSISICEQGLKNVSPPNRLALQQQLDLAKAQLERGVDFISRCPYEIQYNIISCIDSTTAVQCIDVARVWRSRFLGHTGVWESFAPDVTGKQRKLSQLLRIISKNVKNLYIHTRPERLKKHFGLLKTNNFSNLRSLYISDSADNGVNNPEINLVKLLYGALPQVASTLTHLDLSLYSQEGPELSVFRVLSICRNLLSAKFDISRVERERPTRYYRRGTIDPDTNSVGLAHMEQEECMAFESLKKIELTFRSIHPQTVWLVMGELIPFMTHLKSLSVCNVNKINSIYFDSSHLLNYFNDITCCPKLEELRTITLDTSGNIKDMVLLEEEEEKVEYNGDDSVDMIPDQQEQRSSNQTAAVSRVEQLGNSNDNVRQFATATPSSNNNNNGPTAGFRCLILHNLYSTGFVRSRLERSSDTLQTLSLALSVGSVVFTPQDILNSLTMPNLTILSITNGHPSIYCQQLPDVLQRLPALEALYLGGPYKIYRYEHIPNNPIRLVSAIIQRSKLTRLGFQNFGVPDLDGEFFESLMEQYSDMAQEQEVYWRESGTTPSTSIENMSSKGLKSLQIIHCNGFTGRALQHVAKLKSLRKLALVLSPLMSHNKNVSSEMLTGDDIQVLTRELLGDRKEQHSPLLSYLELDNVSLSDQSIYDIMVCKSLKTLIVGKTWGSSKAGEKLLKKYVEDLLSNM